MKSRPQCGRLFIKHTHDRRWTCESSVCAICFELGFELSMYCHRDKNNMRGKLGAIMVVGAFKGFHQLLTVACPHMGLLWADSSDLLHAVTPGSGFRISVVLVNYEWAETGVRPEDGGRVVV